MDKGFWGLLVGWVRPREGPQLPFVEKFELWTEKCANGAFALPQIGGREVYYEIGVTG